MRQMGICLIVIAILILLIAPVIAPAGPQPSSNSGTSSSSGGGGGSRLSLASFTNYLESWQKENPTKYQYMTKLMSNGNARAYKVPSIGLKYSKNKSVNRNDELDIKF